MAEHTNRHHPSRNTAGLRQIPGYPAIRAESRNIYRLNPRTSTYLSSCLLVLRVAYFLLFINKCSAFLNPSSRSVQHPSCQSTSTYNTFPRSVQHYNRSSLLLKPHNVSHQHFRRYPPQTNPNHRHACPPFSCLPPRHSSMALALEPARIAALHDTIPRSHKRYIEGLKHRQ